MAKSGKSKPKLLTRPELAAAFDVLPGTITRWERDGLPVAKKQSRGRPSLFDLSICQKWRDDIEAAKQSEGYSLERERALLARAQREKVETENRIRAESLLEREDVVLSGQAYVKKWRALVRGLPRRFVQLGFITADRESEVERACDELLREINGWDVPKIIRAEASRG